MFMASTQTFCDKRRNWYEAETLKELAQDMAKNGEHAHTVETSFGQLFSKRGVEEFNSMVDVEKARIRFSEIWDFPMESEVLGRTK